MRATCLCRSSGQRATAPPVAGRKRWLLGLAVAAAAVTAFPREARPTTCLNNFLVFFDLNDDEVTRNAAAILDTMISARNTCGHDGRLAIVGYADRSGSSRYNLSLARRRAESVRAYASRQGVPDEMMTVDAHGEDKPLVVTPDGLREPQNRRVEIRYPPPDGW